MTEQWAVAVPIRTTASGEFCFPKKCNPRILADSHDDHYCGIYNVYCAIDRHGNIIRCPACRAAEIGVDAELSRFSSRVQKYGLDCIGNPKRDRLLKRFCNLYLKFATAEGR